jgi:hexosaminidase
MVEKRIKYFLWIIIVSMILNSDIFSQAGAPSIVPLPKKYKYLPGKLFLKNDSFVLKKYYSEEETLTIVLKELDSIYSHVFNKSFYSGMANGELVLGIPSNNKKFKKLCEKNNLIPTDSLGEEGYRLLVDSTRIIISANTNKGLFYGVQSLKQLIKGNAGNEFLQCMEITDYPSFKYRGVMDDISRGPIPTMDYVKYQIRRLAEVKINVFMHYIEHVVKTKKHPEFAPVDGSFTIDELKEIADYGKKYNVTVIGSFQSFGHFGNIASTPEYSHLCESGTLISPVKNESYTFLKEIYDEMIPAFKSPFFHIGCDETFDLGKEESKSLVDRIGYDGVYFKHILELDSFVKKHNLRTMVWGDIFLQYPALLTKIPKDMVVATWDYDPRDSFSNYIEPIKNAGLDFFVCPGVLNSSKIYPDYEQSFVNIKNFASDGLKYGALGILTTVWDDGGAAFWSNDWLGVTFASEQSWNTNNNSFEDFETRFNRGIYGASNNKLTRAILKLEEIKNLEPTDGMNDKILFANLIPEKGKSAKISLIDWDNVEKIINESAEILKESELKFYKDDYKYFSFIQSLYNFIGTKRKNIIEASKLYREAVKLYSNNIFGARDYIKASAEKINSIIRNEVEIRDEYEVLWLNENHVYALDRIIKKYNDEILGLKNVHENLIASIGCIDSSKPLPSISEVCLDITELSGKYFREWMMINPLPNSDRKNPSELDYLEKMGGELAANPKVTEENYYKDIKYRWRRVISEYGDVVNIDEIFKDTDSCSVVYTFANIDVEKDTIVNALVGCSNAALVIINGKKIFETGIENKLLPDKCSFKLPLKAGRNNLMLKISRIGGEFGFTFRLPDSEVRNKKNRYKIVEK